MHDYSHIDEATQFLRNARMGGILTPDQLRAELVHLTKLPAIGSYAVGASVPNWFIEKLDPTKRLVHEYVLFETPDRLDTLLLATMQCANAQLRCVLQLSDPLVKTFLTDALQKKLFTLMFGIENTHQCAVMSVSMDFSEPRELLGELRKATRSEAGITPAMRLTSMSSIPAFRASLIEGQKVEDVIAVLATVPTAEDLERAVRRHGGAGVDKMRATTLH
jgi:hypothetical protein